MYRENKYKQSMNHWYEWAGIGKEDIFEMIYKIVEDMIWEIVPHVVELKMQEYFKNDQLSVNVNPVIENDIKSDIIQAIKKSLN